MDARIQAKLLAYVDPERVERQRLMTERENERRRQAYEMAVELRRKYWREITAKSDEKSGAFLSGILAAREENARRESQLSTRQKLGQSPAN